MLDLWRTLASSDASAIWYVVPAQPLIRNDEKYFKYVTILGLFTTISLGIVCYLNQRGIRNPLIHCRW